MLSTAVLAASHNTASTAHHNSLGTVLAEVSASLMLGMEAFSAEAVNPAGFVTSGLPTFIADFLAIWIHPAAPATPDPAPAV